MSTRMNLKITTHEWMGKEADEMWIYRHHDGYPESVMPDLLFMTALHLKNHSLTLRSRVKSSLDWVSSTQQRLTVTPGWAKDDTPRFLHEYTSRISSYEDTNGLHGDIEWYYELDLKRHKSDNKINSYFSTASIKVFQRTGAWDKPIQEGLTEVAHYVFGGDWTNHFTAEVLHTDDLINFLHQNEEHFNCSLLHDPSEPAWRYVPEIWAEYMILRRV